MKPNKSEARAPEEDGVAPIAWDAAEALTWVSYGVFRHVKVHTQPDESELLDWWSHILAAQLAMGALVTECESILRDGLTEAAELRLGLALSRMDPSGLVVPRGMAG
jgi:hypothetical protein